MPAMATSDVANTSPAPKPAQKTPESLKASLQKQPDQVSQKPDHPPTSPASEELDERIEENSRGIVPSGTQPEQSGNDTVADAAAEVVADVVSDAAANMDTGAEATTDAATTDAPENAAKASQSPEAAVGEFVDEVISKAAFTASVTAEKERVQSLIHDLVGRVQQGGGEVPATSAQSPAAPAAAAAPAPTSPGVPYGDVRAYCVPCDDVPRVRDLFWTQNAETLTVTAVLDVQPPPASARNVTVVFGVSSLNVSVSGVSVIREELSGALDADACLWSLDRSNPLLPSLTLELEKAKPGWWHVLCKSHNPETYRVYHSTPAGASPLPPPPSPQAAALPATSDVPPPDGPPPAAAEASVSSLVVPSEDDVASYGAAGAGAEAEGKEGDDNGEGDTVNATSGPPSRENIDAIIKQYRTAYEKQGPASAEAALQLATFYHHGIGVERSDAEAARLYRFALERGVVDNLAAFQLGLIYNQGCPGLEADPKEAVRWWLVSAKLGNAISMYNLGVMFMKGSGCTMDPNVAIQFFQQAQAINPKLRMPEFSSAQLAERVAQASKLKKRRQKADLSDEERQRRQEQAMETLRYTMYGTAAVVGTTVSLLVLRNWWRNRL